MEELIKKIEKDLTLFIRDEKPASLRGKMGDSVDLRAARLIIYSLQWASVGYQSVLRFSGEKLGRAIGTNFEGREISMVLKNLKKIFEGLGWGKVEIEIKLKDKNVVLRIIDSLTSSGVQNINQNLCFFEEGFIEGSLDGIIKTKGPLILVGSEKNIDRIDVKETKCVGLGDDFCEFTITLGG